MVQFISIKSMPTITKCKHRSLFAKYHTAIFVSAHFLKVVLACIAIERIYPDPEFWHVCVSKAEHFFKVCILPELVGKWYTRPIQNATPRTCTSAASTSASVSETTEPTKHLYCYCRQPEPTDGSASSEMIGCDNPQCSIEWFHTKCLKLKSVPKCRWYCPDCRLLPEYSRKRRKREE